MKKHTHKSPRARGPKLLSITIGQGRCLNWCEQESKNNQKVKGKTKLVLNSPKKVARVMVTMKMKPLPLRKMGRKMGREVWQWIKFFLGHSKDHGPIRCSSIWNIHMTNDETRFKNSEVKKVHWRKYDGHWIKHTMKISKVIWTSPIWRNKSKCEVFQ